MYFTSIQTAFGLLKIDSVASVLTSRKAAVLVGIAIVFVVSIDLLMTRQILSYNNDSEAIMFILTIVIGYGVGFF
jgi:hypothetical protein